MKNIVWIMTDQHKFDALSCAGGPKDLTPNLDAIAQDGYRFTNAYTPSPVCAPARAALFTGCYPPATGVVKNWVPLCEDLPLLTEQLQAKGYRTAMAGKLHLTPAERCRGFDCKIINDAPYSIYANDDENSDYIAWLKQEHFKDSDPVALFDGDEAVYDSDIKRFAMGSAFRTLEQHDTAWTTRCSIDILNMYKGKTPFFLYASYFGPHHPYAPPSPYNECYKSEDMVLPNTFYSSDLWKNPVFVASCDERRKRLQKELSEQDFKELMAAYYGQIKMIDDSIGELIQYLKNNNLYDSTTIIMTSDHGDHMGSHGLLFKSEMYDSCCKVPLIIKPAESRNRHGVCEQVVNTLDLYPTILELAGVQTEQHSQVEGRSLLPLLQSITTSAWENSTYSICGANPNTAVCMLRENQWKLIRLAQHQNDALYELYNLNLDPTEQQNLFTNPKHLKVACTLQNKLDKWFVRQAQNYPEKLVSLNKKG